MAEGFAEELSKRTREAEDIVLSYLPKEEGFQKTVLSAMRYSVEAGGKRLRPLFMMEAYRLFRGADAKVSADSALGAFMAAIEFIHTYSLVHDDLPAMDNDLLRRGKPTTHAVYGEAMGILTGDALLNYAFETVTDALVKNHVAEEPADSAALLTAFSLLSKKAGIFGMIGGQVIDVEGEKTGSMDREKLNEIYRLKTSALLEAAMLVGAVLGGASESELAVIRGVAEKCGLAFQIRDDILDVTGSTYVLGKPVGSDEKNAKTTYVTYEGLPAAKEDVRRLTEEALHLLSTLQRDDWFLRELMTALCERTF